MVFSSTIFLIYFLPFFLITYWLTPQRFRNITALFWSVLFYAWGAPKFIFVLFCSIVVDFFFSKKNIPIRNIFEKKIFTDIYGLKCRTIVIF